MLDRDFSKLLELNVDNKHHVLAALSDLSKFSGIYEAFKGLLSNYGLKWDVRNDDLVIARFTRTANHNDVFEWIRKVKATCADFKDFVDFMVVTGLRYAEAVESYNSPCRKLISTSLRACASYRTFCEFF